MPGETTPPRGRSDPDGSALRRTEIAHRLNNLMTHVVALARQSVHGAETVEAGLAAFEGRVAAVAAAHALALRAQDDRVELGDLSREVLAQAGLDGAMVAQGGAEVRLGADAAQALALFLHELAVLAGPDARGPTIRLNWELDAAQLTLTWERTGSGPPQGIAPFARCIIEELTPADLGAAVRFVGQPDGIHCQLQVPLARLMGRPG